MGLLDIVGSFAGAGANILSRQNKEAEDLETRKQLADHQAKLEAQKIDTIERLREERQKRQQDELVAADDKATTRAKELGTARRMEDFKAKLGQTDATEAELQEAFKQYDNKAVQAGDKTDTQFMDKRRTDAAGDYVKAARETGNTGLLSQAKQSMDFAVKQDSEDAKIARDERRMTETERANREREDLQAQRMEKIITGKSGSSSEVREAINFLDSQRKAITADITDLRARRKSVNDDVNMTPADRKAAKEAFDAEEAKLKARGEKAETMYERLVPKVFKDDEPASAPKTDAEKRGMLPQGSGNAKYKPAATGSGSVLTKEKEDEALQIVWSEYKKLIDAGDTKTAEAVARELKQRFNFDVSAPDAQSSDQDDKPYRGESAGATGDTRTAANGRNGMQIVAVNKKPVPQAQSLKPSYEAWISAKDEKDELLKAASKMSPDHRELYLSSRLPDVEARIRKNESYYKHM